MTHRTTQNTVCSSFAFRIIEMAESARNKSKIHVKNKSLYGFRYEDTENAISRIVSGFSLVLFKQRYITHILIIFVCFYCIFLLCVC